VPQKEMEGSLVPVPGRIELELFVHVLLEPETDNDPDVRS
jgi:hypothetical protein